MTPADTGAALAARPSIRVERVGPVVTIIIDRPARRNAIDAEAATAMHEAFLAFEADDTARVAVLCGDSGTFCAGYDLKSLSGGPPTYHPHGDGMMGPSRMAFTKPVIAAVEGHAVAGGLELAIMCDLRVASTAAIFGVFCRRWGVPLIDGGTVRLPRLIGHSRALDMILTGRPIDAETAFAWGLANRLTAPGEARREAEALAQDIARFPQTCMRADRLASFAQWGMSEADALLFEGGNGERALFEEGVNGAGRFSSGLGRSGDYGAI
jgi:enoyl-CoA hydratase